MGPMQLTGIDINPEAAAQCMAVLGPKSDIRSGDALDLECQWGEEPPDAVIANPPWGGELSQDRGFYRANGYRVASGQFDIFDLFVERALTVTQPGSLLGFILPDAIFQSEHQALRELLLEHTLLLIARIGEGVFDSVYRSTAIVILRHGSAMADHQIECVRFPASYRKLIGQGTISFKNVKALYSHYVPQARFANNRQVVFDIAQDEYGYDVFRKFSSRPSFDWTQRVFLGRGVEIGKRGITVCCSICGSHRSAPSTYGPIECRVCWAVIHEDTPRHEIVAGDARGPDWRPLIVGEDVDRYAVSSRRFIKMGVSGIRYKPATHFDSRKLLIRKTGVGLRSAVDESGSVTIQTVFYVVTTAPKG